MRLSHTLTKGGVTEISMKSYDFRNTMNPSLTISISSTASVNIVLTTEKVYW